MSGFFKNLTKLAEPRVWRRRIAGGTALVAHTVNDAVGEVRLLARRSASGANLRQTTINGYGMLVRADEDVGREIYCFGGFEEEETNLISKMVRETDACIDIGSNIGYYTLLFASKAKKGVVHSFEPIPLNCHLLSVNVLINAYSNVVTNCCAVGNFEGEVDFFIAEDSAYSSFVETGRKPLIGKPRVRVTTLDRYCAEKGIQRVDFLKADVEGAEGSVIEGARRILGDRSSRPRVMMLELYEPMLHKYGTSLSGLLSTLEDYGYRAFVPVKGKLIPFELKDADLFYNFLFLQESDETYRYIQ